MTENARQNLESSSAKARDHFDKEIEAGSAAAYQRCVSGPWPFVAIDPQDATKVLSAWMVKDSGVFANDVTSGIAYAELLLQTAKQNLYGCGPAIIEAVLTDMIKQGHFGIIEHGFIWRLARAAASGSLN
jgi:hypothetical protein